MNIEVDFLWTTDKRWQQAIGRIPHDTYHLPEYVELCARHEGGEPRAFWARCGQQELLIPLLVRPIPQTLAEGVLRDAASPYGLASPVFSVGFWENTKIAQALLEAFISESRSIGLVSGFFRLSPVIEASSPILGKYGEIVDHGPTVIVDLTKGADELFRGFRKQHRQHIRRLMENGYTIELDNWERIDEAIAIYRSAMGRLGAADFYFFPRQYFVDLLDLLSGTCHLLCAIAPDGRVAAASWFFETGGIVQAHLAATADEHVKFSPAKLIFHTMIRWSKERRNTILHLGGGVGGAQDSLFHFKAGFSPLTAPFRTWRLVFSEPQYKALSLAAVRGGEAEQPSGFFPLYRKHHAGPGMPQSRAGLR